MVKIQYTEKDREENPDYTTQPPTDEYQLDDSELKDADSINELSAMHILEVIVKSFGLLAERRRELVKGSGMTLEQYTAMQEKIRDKFISSQS